MANCGIERSIRKGLSECVHAVSIEAGQEIDHDDDRISIDRVSQRELPEGAF
jgi:hypothetical protein